MTTTARQATTQCVDLAKLGQLVKLGRGGQGVVYRAPKVQLDAVKAAAFKQYVASLQAQVDEKVLRDMTRFIFSLSAADGSALIERAAWPVRLVCRNGKVQGFLMPEIPRDFHIDFTLASGGKRTVGAQFQHLLNDDAFAARHGIALSDRTRFELLADAARGLSLLHRHGIAAGDFSAKNLLFRLAPTARCYFIDCDAMSLRGRSVLPQVETPGWDVRSVSSEPLATSESDGYKLALLVLRLLARDQATRSVGRLPRSVPKEVRSLVDRGLQPSPKRRPAAGEWLGPLARAATKASTSVASVPVARPPRKVAARATSTTAARPTGATPARTTSPSRPTRARTTTSSTRPSTHAGGNASEFADASRRLGSLIALGLSSGHLVAVVIAARTGALTGLAQVCRWPYAVGAAAVAVGAAVAGKRSGPPLRLTALAVIATGLSILTAHDPHWLYASAGRVEAWMVDREEVIAGLPDQRGEPCLLPIASAEPLGADRAPLVLVQRFATEQRDILLCATERLELAMVNVPQTEEEPVVALPATLGPNGTIVGGLQADGLQQHLDLAHWWTADQAGTAVLTEAVTDVIVA